MTLIIDIHAELVSRDILRTGICASRVQTTALHALLRINAKSAMNFIFWTNLYVQFALHHVYLVCLPRLAGNVSRIIMDLHVSFSVPKDARKVYAIKLQDNVLANLAFIANFVTKHVQRTAMIVHLNQIVLNAKLVFMAQHATSHARMVATVELVIKILVNASFAKKILWDLHATNAMTGHMGMIAKIFARPIAVAATRTKIARTAKSDFMVIYVGISVQMAVLQIPATNLQENVTCVRLPKMKTRVKTANMKIMNFVTIVLWGYLESIVIILVLTIVNIAIN